MKYKIIILLIIINIFFVGCLNKQQIVLPESKTSTKFNETPIFLGLYNFQDLRPDYQKTNFSIDDFAEIVKQSVEKIENFIIVKEPFFSQQINISFQGQIRILEIKSIINMEYNFQLINLKTNEIFNSTTINKKWKFVWSIFSEKKFRQKVKEETEKEIKKFLKENKQMMIEAMNAEKHNNRIVVLPFINLDKESIREKYGEIISLLLMPKLVEKTNDYGIIERGEIRRILEKAIFSDLKLNDLTTIKKISELSNSEIVVFGEVLKKKNIIIKLYLWKKNEEKIIDTIVQECKKEEEFNEVVNKIVDDFFVKLGKKKE
ncbi:MAG: hypothetical protein ABIB46_00660 [bacterium]